jgi:mono/diheme cytochrome c family protein
MKSNTLINRDMRLGVTTLCLFILIIFTFAACGSESADNKVEKLESKKSVTQKPKAVVKKTGPADINAGKLVYEKHCHYCHGRKGRGKGAVAIAVKPNPADFIRDEKRMAVTDEALYKSLSNGINKEDNMTQRLEKALAMPPFRGVLTPKERWDVIAYVRELVERAKSEDAKK